MLVHKMLRDFSQWGKPYHGDGVIGVITPKV